MKISAKFRAAAFCAAMLALSAAAVAGWRVGAQTLADAKAVERRIEENGVVERVENDMLNDISDPAEREMIRQLISN